MEKIKEKPLCLRMEDAEIEIASVINKHITQGGIPCYILEPIVRKCYEAVVEGKATEVKIMREAYASEEEETHGS